MVKGLKHAAADAIARIEKAKKFVMVSTAPAAPVSPMVIREATELEQLAKRLVKG